VTAEPTHRPDHAGPASEPDPASARQDALAASLSCYHAGGAGPARPHCEGVAVVAYGNIALCGECDKMRSAVGRTNTARPLPAAQLYELMTAARTLAQAGHAVAEAVRQARRAGASWTQVGDALGVSRQAAQQRWSAQSASSADNQP
jgi:hypothetical protein